MYARGWTADARAGESTVWRLASACRKETLQGGGAVEDVGVGAAHGVQLAAW